VYINDGEGILARLYKGLVTSPSYQAIIKLSLILMLTFYGFSYLLGLTSFTQSEMLSRLLKIGFIYLMIGENGWEIYNATFVKFFKAGVDYLVFSVAGAFEGSNTLKSYIATGNFYDKSILFAGVDKNLMLIFSSQVIAKILGLLFVSLFGVFYVYLIFQSLMMYIFAVSNALLLYLTTQVFISVLLALGPIFFVFLIFEKTKEMFGKWIDNLMSFALQQIFLLTVFSFFNVLIYDMVKFILSYKVCWIPIFTIRIPYANITINGFEFWRISGGYSGANIQTAGANFPGLFHILIIYLIAKIMQNFITFITKLAEIKGSMSASGLSGGIAKDTRSLYNTIKKYTADNPINKKVAKVFRDISGVKTKQEREGVVKNNEKLNMLKSQVIDKQNDAEDKYREKNYGDIMKIKAMKSGKEKTEKMNKIKSDIANVRKKVLNKFAEDKKVKVSDLKGMLTSHAYESTPEALIKRSVRGVSRISKNVARKAIGTSKAFDKNILEASDEELESKLKFYKGRGSKFKSKVAKMYKEKARRRLVEEGDEREGFIAKLRDATPFTRGTNKVVKEIKEEEKNQ